jgi:hypothetical protein
VPDKTSESLFNQLFGDVSAQMSYKDPSSIFHMNVRILAAIAYCRTLTFIEFTLTRPNKIDRHFDVFSDDLFP